ncbi:MAG: amylo-alpha-1,6-glucosidase [Gammaproteobacteria bacterium]|nr:amylo-alpha-1,6-glucosidase [Gammaproteobacteria bacterium]MBU1654834.1 amylo-alpha-1,6-glucosidase [Gammaproteobacteria bacterium]MBU1961101.1 amylo-alpha-1,6-glucosidase [Gammaproteobacteria bacterium]
MEQALPRFIHFGREVCNDLDQAERREWWLTNGLGGYAAGTLAGTLTRRYHGLLVAPLSAPLGRRLVFAKADATLVLGDRGIPLHTNRWAGGAIEPRGHMQLESFHLDGRLPVWRYAVGDARLEARIWLEAGANTTYLAWRLLSAPGHHEQPRLKVRLLVNHRDHHGKTHAGDFAPRIEQSDHALEVGFDDGASLRFRSRCGRFTGEKTWIEGFHLSEETRRGLPDTDDNIWVGTVDLPLYPGEWVGFVASTETSCSPYLGEALRERRHQDASLLRLAKARNACLSSAPAWIDQLVLAACDFLVELPRTEGGRRGAVIAGYPWFGEWGRDTFIALPGLTLPVHRHEEARRIIEDWASYLDDGHLPNRFPEGGEAPEYNSADAALWYLEAWRAYVDASRDHVCLKRHWPGLTGIVDAFRRGTRHGIELDPADGLLRAGGGDTQLTWMDARVDGRPVTPRGGKPVEINALWYNALLSLADFARLLDKDPEPYTGLAEKARAGFGRFVRLDGLGLFDVLDTPEGDDARIRPNQVLAVSLHHSPLDSADQARVVAVTGGRLLTSCGLRTLDPADPVYRPRYEGDVPSRDAAYHQGPAWAWLLPHYALAMHKVTGDATAAQALLEPLADQLLDAGLGTLSELFDPEPPHSPRGAPAQAWSVACVLQAWCVLEQATRERNSHA